MKSERQHYTREKNGQIFKNQLPSECLIFKIYRKFVQHSNIKEQYSN